MLETPIEEIAPKPLSPIILLALNQYISSIKFAFTKEAVNFDPPEPDDYDVTVKIDGEISRKFDASCIQQVAGIIIMLKFFFSH